MHTKLCTSTVMDLNVRKNFTQNHRHVLRLFTWHDKIKKGTKNTALNGKQKRKQ